MGFSEASQPWSRPARLEHQRLMRPKTTLDIVVGAVSKELDDGELVALAHCRFVIDLRQCNGSPAT